MSKFYNGKIKCISSSRGHLFSIGKTYEVKDGVFKDDKGYTVNKGAISFKEEVLPYNRFKDLAEINDFFKKFFNSFGVTFKESKDLLKTSIHITTDGTTTTCIKKENGKVVKRTKAICNPHDTFDFETGARIAFDRCCTSFAESSAFTKVREVKRQARVGEYVKALANSQFARFKAGDILLVTNDCSDSDLWRNRAVGYNNTNEVIKKDDYVVLEGYKGGANR